MRPIKALACIAAALLLAACAAAHVEPGPAPAPVGFEPRAVFHASGTGDFQTFVGALPFSAFVKWTGNGTIEARMSPTGVTVYMDGDSTWVVTPAPGYERDAEHAVTSGDIIIRRNGAPAGLTYPHVPQPPAPELPAAPAPTAPKPVSFQCQPEVCEGRACAK